MIEEQLERVHKKLDVIGFGDIRDPIKKRIADLKEERATRLEITQLSQLSWIRKAIEKIIDGDLTLREKVKPIFREQGITITAVLTAFGFIISIIIISLTGGAGAAGGYPNPPKHPNRLKERLKNKLKALAKLLVTIAGKAAAALLGIIGTIIAGVLNFFKKVYTAFRMLSPIFSISCFVKPRLESMIHSDQLVCANSGLHKPTEIHVKRGNRCETCTEPQQAASPHPNVL